MKEEKEKLRMVAKVCVSLSNSYFYLLPEGYMVNEYNLYKNFVVLSIDEGSV